MIKVGREIKKYFAEVHGVVAVYLFGSHAKGRAHEQSDVDIAVLYKSGACKDPFEQSLKISCDLMKRLNCNKVDVVVLNTATPVLKNQIYKYGVKVLCNDRLTAVKFKARSIIEYLDLLPVRRPSELAMKKRAHSYGR